MKMLSIVVPIYNESENLHEFYATLTPHLSSLGMPFEVILVDDGSTDSSLETARNFCKNDPSVKVIAFSRNFGQQSAITAGLNHARGDAVVVMDADLQDPPDVISKLIEKLSQGYDVVYGIRVKRKENIIKRFLFKAFYRLLRLIAIIKLPLDAGDFCIMSRRIVDLLNELPERNRYIRGLRTWVGFHQTGITFERGPRYSGKTKYTSKKLLNIALDGIISFSRVPFQALLLIGAGLMFSAILIGLSLVFSGREIDLLLCILILVLFLSGLQLSGIGVLGEMVWHISDEAKCRPSYIIMEKIGFDDS